MLRLPLHSFTTVAESPVRLSVATKVWFEREVQYESLTYVSSPHCNDGFPKQPIAFYILKEEFATYLSHLEVFGMAE